MVLLNGMLKDHMNTNNILVPEECGLRTRMSTNDAVIELTDKILKSVNKTQFRFKSVKNMRRFACSTFYFVKQRHWLRSTTTENSLLGCESVQLY